jgi:Holliday junction resolvasome RuvABC endonuclease subunit
LSTQAVFKSLGIANYIFSDCEQIEYKPSTVKKTVCGKGNADKKQVQQQMEKIFPKLSFTCDDESDACAIGYTYFLERRNK